MCLDAFEVSHVCFVLLIFVIRLDGDIGAIVRRAVCKFEGSLTF